MNNYQSSTPRVVLGIAAIAMTAGTFAVFVVLPATIDSSGEELRTQAVAKVVTPAVTEAVITSAPIQVLGVRDTKLASAPLTAVDPIRVNLPGIHRVSACASTRDRSVSQTPRAEYRSEVWPCGLTEDSGH